MLYEGKKMYLKDIFLSHLKDNIKIAYTEEEIKWAKENERLIWQYFVEKQILFQTDSDLVGRFVEPAPFSKFYLQIDNESPGKIGVWLGWQMSKIAKKTQNLIIELLNLSSQELLIFQNTNQNNNDNKQKNSNYN